MADERAKKSASTIGGLMVVGMGAGLAIGAALESVPVCMAAGMAAGIGIGALADVFNRRRQDG